MKQTITILLLFICTITALAQDLKVESFSATTQILQADKRKVDSNGDPCAVVEVLLPDEGANFVGNLVGNPQFNINKYWVYMTEGSKQLQINLRGYNTLDVYFGEYGVNRLQQNTIYELKVSKPTQQTVADPGGNYVVMTVKPVDAMVTIDDKQLMAEPTGEYMKMYGYGTHSYTISAAGYMKKMGTFSIERSKRTELNVVLESAFATLSVTCPTAGAAIYVDNKYVGTSPWTGSLQDGMYLIEAKKDGHRSVQKSVSLSEQQKLNVSLDALTPIVGNLNIAYRPLGADIYIDGQHKGSSPSVFSDILIGTHTVEIKKDGYASETKTITLKEGETANVEGTLNAALNLDEQYDKAVKFHKNKDYTQAVSIFKVLAERGHAKAQNYLGFCCKKGQGVSQDYSKAVEWYTKSANQGYAIAQNNLGVCYDNGQGVSQDYSKAVEWYTKAANQGYADAQYNLGLCYDNGQGVSKDYSKAVEWYTKAANQGYAGAQCNLGYCYKYGQGVSKDYSKAVEWYTKAANQGYAGAQCNLGFCYKYGQGVSQDY
ncbi:MAG: SEL1-like repeat protein, partial [Prevotellaceae bacterium]|nr:SEL1-like repeat protein [Candidatus Minthosoma caballi]